jgi:signal peptide peptidase SppA
MRDDVLSLDLASQIWAMLPAALHYARRGLELYSRVAAADSFYCRDGSGGRQAVTDSTAAYRAGPRGGVQTQFAGRGTIGILPLAGPIMPRDCFLTMLSGGTGLESWVAALQELVGNSGVKSIVIACDSPGGSVYGCTEAAAAVRDAAKQKQVMAVVSPVAASAAYWIISGCTEIAIQPSGQCGSVGVFTQHEDHSAELEKAGVVVSTIASSRYKAERDESQPLSADARAHLQHLVNSIGDMFTADVAKGRGATDARVKKDFGQGRMLLAKNAVAVGMADRIATLQDVVNGLASGAPNDGRHLPSAVAARLAFIAADGN